MACILLFGSQQSLLQSLYLSYIWYFTDTSSHNRICQLNLNALELPMQMAFINWGRAKAFNCSMNHPPIGRQKTEYNHFILEWLQMQSCESYKLLSGVDTPASE